MTSRRLLVGGLLATVVVLGGAVAVVAAERHALDAETAHVEEQLADEACLDDWGADEGAATKAASVTGVTPLGLRVCVQLPYAYRVEHEGEPLFADTAAEAVYVVTLLGTRRLGGDEIDPC